MPCGKRGESVPLGKVLPHPVVVAHLKKVLKYVLPVIKLTYSLLCQTNMLYLILLQTRNVRSVNGYPFGVFGPTPSDALSDFCI